MRRSLPILVLASMLLATASVVRAERVVVDPPMKLVTYRGDRSEVAGQLVAYDDEGFELRAGKPDGGTTQTVAWDELPPASVVQVHERLWATTGAAEQWLALGERLARRPGGKAAAERALARAVKLDPSLKDRADAARRADAAAPTAAGRKPATSPASTDFRSGDADDGGGERLRDVPPPVDGAPDAGPRTVGEVNPNAWRPLSDADHAAAVAKLKAVGERARQEVTPDLALYETTYFLFYSDLKPSEAKQWAGLLDRMYARLAVLFGVERDRNIWRGKALVFVFRKADDYRTFQQVIHDTDAGTSAGLCHQYGNGDVHIAFYRQPQDLVFAHVLVHESVHGFLHRYRSPVPVPVWANEGLSEVIAAELVPNRSKREQAEQVARAYLQGVRSLGRGFFRGPRLAAEQYPVAQVLTEFMIRQNKAGYVAFIDGIKDGEPWEAALDERYGAGLDRLVPAFGQSLGVRDLRAGRGGP
jgi:hypothetical protein